MLYTNRKEKRDAMVKSVRDYMTLGFTKTTAVKKTANDFSYLTDIPVWKALKAEREENENDKRNT